MFKITAVCDNCGDEEDGDFGWESQYEAERAIAKMGWKYRSEAGWCCPSCATLFDDEGEDDVVVEDDD